MATTLLQKLKLAFRGWQRRRDDAQEEFLRRNLQWGTPAATTRAGAEAVGDAKPKAIDRDGLQVAYLDDSGAIDWYLDTETGDVVDVRDGRTLAAPRYRRVPRRSAQSEAEDRRAFSATVADARQRAQLAAAADAAKFRELLATDRALERAWYSFKNDRALAAIEEWLRTM